MSSEKWLIPFQLATAKHLLLEFIGCFCLRPEVHFELDASSALLHQHPRNLNFDINQPDKIQTGLDGCCSREFFGLPVD